MARTWQLGHETWQLPAEGAIMGIVNVTPDSFSDGGLHASTATALAHAQQLIAEGADILDIGGESTRPGATPIDEAEEQKRVLPVIRALREAYPAGRLRLSIDTRYPCTARLALEAGADIINDITGLSNPAMIELCANPAYPCGIIIMHMQGCPATMQKAPQYHNVVAEVKTFFTQRVAAAEQAGISPARLCLDPGIGFGKTTAHNLALIHHLSELRVRDLPLMMALSRKRFLNDLHDTLPALAATLPGAPSLGETTAPDTGSSNAPSSQLNAKTSPLPTVIMSLLAATNGADLHRVHDVAPLRAALQRRQTALPQGC